MQSIVRVSLMLFYCVPEIAHGRLGTCTCICYKDTKENGNIHVLYMDFELQSIY